MDPWHSNASTNLAMVYWNLEAPQHALASILRTVAILETKLWVLRDVLGEDGPPEHRNGADSKRPELLAEKEVKELTEKLETEARELRVDELINAITVLHSDLVGAHHNAGYFCVQGQRMARAVHHMERCCELFPKYPRDSLRAIKLALVKGEIREEDDGISALPDPGPAPVKAGEAQLPPLPW